MARVLNILLREKLRLQKKNYKLDGKLEYKSVPLVPESLLRSGINKVHIASLNSPSDVIKSNFEKLYTRFFN